MADPFDRSREDFFSEAQEIIETYSRNLLALDSTLKSGGNDPALVNEAFRAVHTLKGLAGLFGAAPLGALAHRLEDVLDDLRLGRAEPTPAVLDVLFRAVDVFGQLLQGEKEEADDIAPNVDKLLDQITEISAVVGKDRGDLGEFELDPGMLAVLTEYEEHRLRTNIQDGLGLYRLRVKFDLMTIDKALDEIKSKAKLHGEIITYLPTGESSSPDTIELDVLLASPDGLSTLIGTLGAENVVIEAIPRQGRAPQAAQRAPASFKPRAPDSVMPRSMSVRAGAESGAAIEQAASLRSLTQTVRVDIRKLDHLMNIVGELAIVRTTIARLAERMRRDGQRQLATELQRIHRPFDRRLSELQEGILEVRMVPLGQIFDRLARVVRRIARDAEKEIRLVITGAETEIDKLIVEELSDPLMHMIHNACDHGIELPADRQKVGKPVAGTIALNAFQKGSHVVIEIEDDGAGIDDKRLVERAVISGQIPAYEASELNRAERLALIFMPGVSTRTEADDVSGRGVGMDVVKTNISRLGGIIDIHSESGIGTKMTITLPITLAIVSALIVRVCDQTFAIPLSSVSEAITFDEHGVRFVEHREVMSLRGETLPLCRLDRLLDLPEPEQRSPRRFVVIASLGSRPLGLVVDYLYGQQDIVIKALGSSLKSVRGFSGATELGDQRVGLVLDVPALIEEVLSASELTRGRLAELHG